MDAGADRRAGSGDGRWLAGLAVVTVVAAVLRFARVGHGLPDVVYVDAFKFVGEAWRMASTGDLTPQVLQFPGLFTHLLAVIYWLGDVSDPAVQHLVGRTVAAVAGTLAVVATGLLGHRVGGPWSSWLAATLLAVGPVAVTHSRIPAPDILLTLFVTLALWLLLGEGRNWRHLAAAGSMVGLALGAKFTALLFLPAVPLVLALTGSERSVSAWVRQSCVVLVSAAAVFVVTTPAVVTHLAEYAARLVRESHIQRAGMIGRVQDGYLDYLTSTTPTWEQPWMGTSIVGNHGWLVLVVAVAAVVSALALRGGRRVQVLALLVVAYLAVISGPGRIKAARFLLPVLPALFVLVAWQVERCLVPGRWRRAGMAVAVAVAAALVAWPAARSVRALAVCSGPTTIDLARQWMATEVPPGSTVFLSPFFVDGLRRPDLVVLALPNPGSRQYDRPPELGPSPEREPLYHPALVAELRAADTAVVVLNSWFDDALSPVPENLRHFPRSVAGRAGFEAALAATAVCRLRVEGLAAGRLGPDIEIWDFRAGPDGP